MNVGKVFEKQFTKYFPAYCLTYKIPDSTANFNGSQLTYSVQNPFDYFVFDRRHKKSVLCLELKTVADKWISFERDGSEKKTIHYHQIKGLEKFAAFGLEAGFVIEFRAIEKTVYININDFINFMNIVKKSSLNYDDLEKFNIPHIEISQKILKVNYKYEIEDFLEKLNLGETKYEI